MPHEPSLAPFKQSVDDASRRDELSERNGDICKESKLIMSREEHIHHTVDDFVPIRVLGRGAMGTVLLAAHRRSKKEFAIKAISKEVIRKRRALGGVEMEKEVLALVRGHPFLPHLHSHFESSNYAFLAMDYCCGGDLNVLRHRQAEKRFSEAAIRFYAAELVLALEHLHQLGIVYRDLKPENVLISDGGHVVLTDFDLSLRLSTQDYCSCTADHQQQHQKVFTKQKKSAPRPICLVSCVATGSVAPEDDVAEAVAEKGRRMPVGCVHTQNGSAVRTTSAGVEPRKASSRHFVGTEEYVAPEVIRGEGYSFAVDWWALGVLLYELLYARTPFKGPDRKSTFSGILHREAVLCGTWSPAQDLIRRLLVKEPSHRLAHAACVKAHLFFQGVQWEKLQYIARPPVVPDAGHPLGLYYCDLESFLAAAAHTTSTTTSRSSEYYEQFSDEIDGHCCDCLESSSDNYKHHEIPSLSVHDGLPTSKSQVSHSCR